MAAKPTLVPVWATAGAIVEPSSGKKSAGWVPGEKPPAQELNWLDNLNGQWAQYLSDGALSGNHSIAGDLTITGLGSFDDGIVTNDASSIGGTLGVTGRITATDGIDVPTAKNITLAGTAKLKHGSRTEVYGPGEFSVYSSSPVVASSGITGVGGLRAPLRLPVGKRITSLNWRCARGGAGTIQMDITIYDNTGTLVAQTVTSVTTGSAQVTAASGTLNYTLAAGQFAVLTVSMNNAANGFTLVEVLYDEP